jgi:hypothetical protein
VVTLVKQFSSFDFVCCLDMPEFLLNCRVNRKKEHVSISGYLGSYAVTSYDDISICSFLYMNILCRCYAICNWLFHLLRDLITWATTFIVGGDRLFGPMWNDVAIYIVADKLGISGYMG